MPPAPTENRVPPGLLGAAVLSGAAALVFQVVWIRRITLVFGSTTLATATVLAVFMGGLALGAWLLGSRADGLDSRRTLGLYAAVEAGIGLSGLVVPLLLVAVAPLYLRLYAALERAPALFLIVQAVLVAIVLLPATTLMGGTYPLVARAVVRRDERLGEKLSQIYAANTIGAAGGIALVLVALLPGLGQRGTELVALALNLGAAALAWAVRARAAVASDEPPARPTPARPVAAGPASRDLGTDLGTDVWPLLLGTALSGFAAMVGEVVWSRILVLSIGSSVYAFGVVVLVFLAGSAAGSALLGRLRPSAEEARRAFVWAQLGIAVWVLFSTFFAASMGGLFVELFPADHTAFGRVLAAQVLVGAVLCLVPSVLFGLSFPAIATAVSSPEHVGRSLGRVTVANTAGTVAGSLLAGFVLVPGLGLREALLAVVGIAALAARVVAPVADVTLRRVATGTLLGGLLLGALVPPWSKQLLASGAGFSAPQLGSAEAWRAGASRSEVLYYADGLNTTISVDRSDGHLFYRSNGKTDASTHPHDLAVQVLIGQVPMLLHPDPTNADVFVLGLGTGASAAAAARYPVRSIEIFDIEARGRGAVELFDSVNRGILSDPRVTYRVADGRNAILARPARYDVIIADPSDLWVAGVGNLFTKEFYALARRRLKPGGVFAQWLHTHSLTVEELRILAATMRAVFPDASMWRLSRSDILLVGREAAPLPIETVRKKLEIPGVGEDLRSIGIWDPAAVFAAFLLDGDDLGRLAGRAGIHTDDHPEIEFRTPRQLYLDNTEATDLALRRLQTHRFPARLTGLEEASMPARSLYLLGFGYASLERLDAGIELIERAVDLDPADAKFRIGLANQYERTGRLEESAAAFRAALALDRGDEEAILGLARTAGALGGAEEAEATLRGALTLPDPPAAVNGVLGSLLLRAGRDAEALPFLLRGVQTAPTDLGLRFGAARALVSARRIPDAQEQLKAVAGLIPPDAGTWKSFGDVLLLAGAAGDAQVAYQRALELDPGEATARAALEQLLRGR